MDAAEFTARLRASDFYRGQIVYQHRRQPRRPVPGPAPEEFGPVTAAVCAALGIPQLYGHQAEALEAVRAGRDLVLASGPAGGKALAFQAPAVERALCEPPGATLVICPNKVVAAAQERKFARVAEHLPRFGPCLSRYDGDLGTARRRRERQRSVVITNPEMLHRGILPNHPRWAAWFSRLRMVVLEELHAYSGLFGSNVAALMRRLMRVCRHYGVNELQVVGTSSTLPNPAGHAWRLTGRQAQVLRHDASPSEGRTFLFWRPAGEVPTVETGRLMAELLEAGCSTIAFSRARVACELIAEYGRRFLREKGREGDAVVAYRGGLRPEERAELEPKMHARGTVGISATNLLELGLDVPSLDAVLVCGWPGSLASFFQQSARAGRAGQESLSIFVGLHDPVNAFLMAHPQYVFERPFEPGVVELNNPHVMAGHLRCAAQELPLRADEAAHFGEAACQVLRVLEDRAKVYRRDDVWYSATSERPGRELSLRGSFERNVVVQDAATNAVIGEVDWMGSIQVVHPRAIYLHEGRQYRVTEFKPEERHAWVEPVEVNYYTNPLGHTFVHSVDECLRERDLPGGAAFFGEVTAGAVTTGYEQRRYETNDLVRSVELEIPSVLYETMATWLCLSEAREAEFAALGLNPEYYGLGNALRIVMPMFMTCDVLDLRPWSGQTNFSWPALYFYERHRRGLGFSERAFDALGEVMEAAADNLRDCACDDGCPLCVGDPPRPYMVNNPELEADLIPSRTDVRLVLEAMRTDAPVEELLERIVGRDRADSILGGRRELLAARRREARQRPPRWLPSDQPAESTAPATPLPLQLQRGVRRRIEKLRTAEQTRRVPPVERAAVPEPEPEESLPRTDPESRRRDAVRLDMDRLRELSRRRPPSGPDGTEAEGGRSEKAASGAPTPDTADLAAEAVRRVRERRKNDRCSED